MNLPQTQSLQIRRRLRIIRVTRYMFRHWLAIVVVLLGILNALPFLAPVAMRFGWTAGGDAIYLLYSPLCHQMAQRSFFIFGPKAMYSLDELPLNFNGNNITDLLLLKAFQGNSDLGWKVAWSDRMVAMYGGIWIASIVYGLLRRKSNFNSISIWIALLLTLPITIDGITHMVSDLNGLTAGFRFNNEWLAKLTTHSLPDSFYQGDAFGSFNSWMRLASGVLFGIGIAAFGLPLVNAESRSIVRTLSEKLARYDERIDYSSNDHTPNGA
ncbi:MAG: DUF2085 domain-containing protein [Anaerolineae bacterium]|nr:DUF2085 domain-containing protein [Anaerolineae bacterium]